MTDLLKILGNLHRPRLLIRAARFGIQDYNRNRDLRKLTSDTAVPRPVQAVKSLMMTEAQMEETRKNGDASYSVSRHVEVLIALMAEARLLPQQTGYN